MKKQLLTYCKKVTTSKIVAGKYFKLACQKFIEDSKRKDLFFDDIEAEKIVKFTETMLRHWEGKWRNKPILLNDFQKLVVLSVFCWKRKDTGYRRFRTFYVQIARKNGKTTLLAVMFLYHLLIDKEVTPQILIGANNEDQAKICSNAAGQIIKSSPILRTMVDAKEIRLYEYKGRITKIAVNFQRGDKEKLGTLEAISRDPRTKDGSSPSVSGIDEYHEANDDKLLNVLESGMGGREQPILGTITTAGFNKSGACYMKLREQSVKVLEGIVEDDSHFSVICEPDIDDLWSDESTWEKSNPMMREIDTILPYLKDRYVKAKNEGGSKEVDFKTKNLNIWTSASQVWINDEDWMRCDFGKVTLDDFKGLKCYGGLDLAKSVDLNAFAMVAQKGDKILVWGVCWLPEEKVQNHRDGVDYQKWIDTGEVMSTPGNVVDHQYIITYIIELCKRVDLVTIGYDRALAYHGAIQGLLEQDIPVNEVIQAARHLNVPTKELEKFVMNKELSHGGDPSMRWQLSNVELFVNAEGLYKPDKGKSKNKIDLIAAMINAIHEMMRQEEEVTDISQMMQ